MSDKDFEQRLTRSARVWYRYVARFAREETCKGIFDHLRNLGICAAVGAAAVWKYRNAATSMFEYFDFAICGLLAALCVWLFFVNQSNLFQRMYKAGVDPRLVLFFGQVYSLVAVSIVASLIAGRQ